MSRIRSQMHWLTACIIMISLTSQCLSQDSARPRFIIAQTLAGHVYRLDQAKMIPLSGATVERYAVGGSAVLQSVPTDSAGAFDFGQQAEDSQWKLVVKEGDSTVSFARVSLRKSGHPLVLFARRTSDQ